MGVLVSDVRVKGGLKINGATPRTPGTAKMVVSEGPPEKMVVEEETFEENGGLKRIPPKKKAQKEYGKKMVRRECSHFCRTRFGGSLFRLSGLVGVIFLGFFRVFLLMSPARDIL